MRFTKMQGAGNDYIYVDCMTQPVPDHLTELARKITDRHFGVGGDGLILVRTSKTADAQMQMFNSDGTEAEMCGNGIRCVAKLLYDRGICQKQEMEIETGAGVLAVSLSLENDRVSLVRVNMGIPILDSNQIPTTLDGNPVVNRRLEIDGQQLEVTCVSMGNPHCVVFVDRLTDKMVFELGPKVENSSAFPQRTNVEFVQVISSSEVRQRTWERGSGETLACGTGASAVCVAGVLSGRTGRTIVDHLLGGDLELDWEEDSNHVFMTGPAVEVFSGEWPQ